MDKGMGGAAMCKFYISKMAIQDLEKSGSQTNILITIYTV